MILHIFNDSLFSKQFISKSYLLENQDESYYAIFTKKHLDKSSLPSASNIIDITKNQDNIKLLKYKMKEADKIVIHSMSNPLILWLALHPKLIQKSIPVFWGGDLYDFFKYLRDSKGLKRVLFQIRYVFLKKIYRKVKNVGCILPADYQFFKDHFISKAKYNAVVYSMEYFNEEFLSKINSIELNDSFSPSFNICIGHSATRVLNHIITMQDIEKYENISLTIPLSYGDSIYAKEVIEYSRNYKHKVKILNDFFDFDKYIQICASMDMLIINAHRQIALGNIFAFLILGKYVCLPKNSVTYQFLKDVLHIDLIAYDELLKQGKNLSLSEFPIDREKNKKIILEYTSQKNFIDLWNRLTKL